MQSTPSPPSPTTPSPHLQPNAAVLRNRAATLRAFADTLERLLVIQLDHTSLGEHVDPAEPSRERLRHTLLRYNLRQLHATADELRDVAHRMWHDAAGMELAQRIAPTPDSSQ